MCDRGIAGVYGYMCGSEINQNCVCVVVCVTERDIDDLCVCVCVCVCWRVWQCGFCVRRSVWHTQLLKNNVLVITLALSQPNSECFCNTEYSGVLTQQELTR